MPWRVDEVQQVVLAVRGVIGERNGIALDRNASLTLDIHVVEQLIAELPL